jgi:hypothetical protein
VGLEVLEDRSLPSGVLPLASPDYVLDHAGTTAAPHAVPGPTGLTPSQVRAANGFTQITDAGSANGAGTTIAIVDAYGDPTIAGDLHAFDQQFGLADPTLTRVNQTGGSTLPAGDAGWSVETSLDVEWAHAVAPAANILLVEASSSSFSDLLTAVRYAAAQPGVVAVSMSWGGGEFSGESTYDSTFTTPAGHTGVTFVASSGDDGAPVSYPSASPDVLSVGGTTLNLADSTGDYGSESAWAGSGGGVSAYESQPSYQKGVVSAYSTTARTNPDVSYDADPNTGFPVYDSYANGTTNPWEQVGGTSDAAPQWAALVAIADQGRALAGEQPLDGPSQTLPMLYKLPSADFHDVTTGSSQGSPAEPAGAGYDLATGRGTPVANLVVAGLVGSSTSAPAPLPATHFVVSTTGGGTAGVSFSVTVTAEDANNNVVTNYAGTVHFTSTDGSALLPASYTFKASDDGVHTFTGVTLKTAGSQTVSVASSTGGLTGQAAVSVAPAAVSKVVFSQQPASTAAAGASLGPAVTVQLFDAYGNLETTDNSDVVRLTLGTNPAGGTLGGTTSATVSGGVAAFAGLWLDKAAAGYTLQASCGSVSGTSARFTITPGAASQLAFAQQPTSTAEGRSISPAVTVRVLDAYGNLETTDSTDVVSVRLGNNPSGASLSGTTTVTARAGVATFTGLSVSAGGNGYTLTATGGNLTGATSQAFNISLVSTHLAFIQQPASATAGAHLSPNVVVEVLDANNAVVTTDNSDRVTLSLAANPAGGVLEGTITVTVTGGVATFSNLSMNKAGVGYTLKATSGALTSATSTSFAITPAAVKQVVFVKQPAGAAAGASLGSVTVQLLDAYGNLEAADNSDVVSVALGTNPGGTLAGTATATVSGGVATFAGLWVNKTGAYTLQASCGSVSGTSTRFTVTAGAPSQLAFSQQPAAAKAGSAMAAVKVQVLDAYGNLVTGDSTDVVTLALNSPAGATLGGTTTVKVVGGVATFSTLTVSQGGTSDTLLASSGTLTGATSTSFTVTGSSPPATTHASDIVFLAAGPSGLAALLLG